MRSLWNDADALKCSNTLALRAYTSRLLGGDPSLVLYGGGNTSIKIDENGIRVLYVKGTGSDLAYANEQAFTPLRLDQVNALLARPHLDNSEMMLTLNGCLVRRPAPRPSIETLLHAGLPFCCIEHTHADAVLAAMNVKSIGATHAEVYGDLAPLVPYHHSGHALAKACMAVFRTQSSARTIGLVLAFHGVVAFGENPRIAYENMIELVTRAECYLQSRRAWDITPSPRSPSRVDASRLTRLHAEITAIAGKSLAMHVSNEAPSLAFARHTDLADISQQGPATPQHAVYTKRVPMIGDDVRAYAAAYRAYLDTHLGKTASALIDAAPRIVLDPDIGIVAFGTNQRDAQKAAEMYAHDITVITRATLHGRYCSAPARAIAQAEFEYGGYTSRSHAP